jgi:hypothetical protein
MVKRHIDQIGTTIQIKFTNGEVFGPVEFNPTTDMLTRMVAAMEGRLAKLEHSLSHTLS